MVGHRPRASRTPAQTIGVSLAVAFGVVGLLGMAGCSSGSHNVVRTPFSGTTAAASTTSSSTSAAPSTAAGTQTLTVAPSSGLSSGQSVTVNAVGFSPNEPLVVIECANKGAQTSEGDCDLTDMQTVVSGANGTVQADLTVSKGPFGANNIVCASAQSCLVSVNQASPTPTQQASATISFG